MGCVLSIPQVYGDPDVVESFAPRVSRASWTRNPHTKADELDLTLDFADAGIDPRILSNAVVSWHMSEEDGYWPWQMTPDNQRFEGIVTEVRRTGSHDGGDSHTSVEVKCVDYTAFFIRAKPFNVNGVPRITQTLTEAWQTICAGFDTLEGGNPVSYLSNAIEFRGIPAPGPILAFSMPKRFMASTQGPRIGVDRNADAWAIWQQCVGQLGLISFFDRGKLVVTTTAAYWTSIDPVVLTWGGKNGEPGDILSFDESRENQFDQRSVGVSSFNVMTGAVLESIYPPRAQTQAQNKGKGPGAAKHVAAGGKVAQEDSRIDWFSFPGVSEQSVLDEIAKRAFEERAKLALKGEIHTAELALKADSGREISALDLQPGDSLRVRVDTTDLEGELLSQLSNEAKAGYLIQRGYSRQVAMVIANSWDYLQQARGTFYVTAVRVDFRANRSESSVDVRINYCNSIR